MLYFMSTAAEQEYARWIKKKEKKKASCAEKVERHGS